MNFYDALSSVYNKKKVDLEINDDGINIVLTKILIRNKKNANALKRVADYLFYITPLHYYYLLYFSIPFSYRAPKTFKTVEKSIKKEDKLLTKIKYVLNWSDRELEFNRVILEKTVLKNKKYWKNELGVGK